MFATIRLAVVIIGLLTIPHGASAGELKLLRQLGEPWLRHGEPISAVAFSPDGARLASAGGCTVRLFKPISGKEVQKLALLAPALSIAFAPDGLTLAVATSDGIILWDLNRDEATPWDQPTLDQLISAIVFSPDGKRLAAAGGGVTLWDVASATELRFLRTQLPPGRALAFSPDGALVAAGDRQRDKNGCIRLWDAATGELQRQIAMEVAPAALRFAADGLAIVSISQTSNLQFWNLATCEMTRSFSLAFEHERPTMPRLPPAPVSLITNAATCFSSSPHDRLVRQWRLADGKLLRNFPVRWEGAGELAVCPDGKWLAIGGLDGTIAMWDVASGLNWSTDDRHLGSIFGVGFSADGKTLYSACTGDYLNAWDPATGKQKYGKVIDFSGTEGLLFGAECVAGVGLRAERPGRQPPPGIGVQAGTLAGQRWRLDNAMPIPFDKDGNLGMLGVASDQGGVRCLDAADDWRLAEIVNVYGGGKPDQRKIPRSLPAGWKGLLLDHQILRANPPRRADPRLADPLQRSSELKTYRMIQDRVTSWVVVADDGRTWAKLPSKGSLEVYEVGTQALLAELKVAEPLHARGLLIRDRLAFSPGGRWLAVARDDDELAICDVATGKEHWKVRSGHGSVTALAFAPDGAVLASGGLDGAVRLWDVSALRPQPIELTPTALMQYWIALRGGDAAAARAAGWQLVDASAQSVPFLRRRLKPVAGPTPERLDRLVAALDAKEFAAREEATLELEELGVLAAERLRQVLAANPPLEVRNRVDIILKRLPTEPMLTLEERRALRAVAVLDHIGSAEAIQHLRELATGHDAMVLTQEAKRVLKGRN